MSLEEIGGPDQHCCKNKTKEESFQKSPVPKVKQLDELVAGGKMLYSKTRNESNTYPYSSNRGAWHEQIRIYPITQACCRWKKRRRLETNRGDLERGRIATDARHASSKTRDGVHMINRSTQIKTRAQLTWAFCLFTVFTRAFITRAFNVPLGEVTSQTSNLVILRSLSEDINLGPSLRAMAAVFS